VGLSHYQSVNRTAFSNQKLDNLSVAGSSPAPTRRRVAQLVEQKKQSQSVRNVKNHFSKQISLKGLLRTVISSRMILFTKTRRLK